MHDGASEVPSLSSAKRSSFSRTEIKLEMSSRLSVEELVSRINRTPLSANTARLDHHRFDLKNLQRGLLDIATVAANKTAQLFLFWFCECFKTVASWRRSQ